MGVLVAEKWVENVIEVKKLSERIMLIRVSIGVNTPYPDITSYM